MSKNGLRISIGCDPELFLRDKKTGLFISAHDKLPGTKDKPHEVNSGAVQVDGVAAEFNIQPSYSQQEFTNYIKNVTTQLQNMVGDYELVCRPAVTFEENYFKSLPESTRELGCNPDYNAWTGQVNEKPKGDLTTMRTGAGHVHVGFKSRLVNPDDPIHFEDCAIIARQMDYYLGMYSLMWDKDSDRRKLYGCAGAFRPKPYGLEYRTLSNKWLATPELQQWVWNAAFKSLNDLLNQRARAEDEFKDVAREVINNSLPWWEDKPEFKDFKKLAKLSGLSMPPVIPKEAQEMIGYVAPKEYVGAYPNPGASGGYYGVFKNGYVDTNETLLTEKEVKDKGLMIVNTASSLAQLVKKFEKIDMKKAAGF
jgi:hypothetical protein